MFIIDIKTNNSLKIKENLIKEDNMVKIEIDLEIIEIIVIIIDNTTIRDRHTIKSDTKTTQTIIEITIIIIIISQEEKIIQWEIVIKVTTTDIKNDK